MKGSWPYEHRLKVPLPEPATSRAAAQDASAPTRAPHPQHVRLRATASPLAAGTPGDGGLLASCEDKASLVAAACPQSQG